MSLLQMSRADCHSSYCKLLMSIVPIVHSVKCPKENEDICMPFNCRHACGPLCEVPDLWVLVMVGFLVFENCVLLRMFWKCFMNKMCVYCIYYSLALMVGIWK